MVLYPPGGGDKIGQVEVGDDMHNSYTVHGCAIYCDAANSGAVLGGRVTVGS